MPKIPNWEKAKQGSKTRENTWVHDSGVMVQVRKNPNSRPDPEDTYVIDYMTKKLERKIIGTERLKRNAKKKARQYMKNHEDGSYEYIG